MYKNLARCQKEASLFLCFIWVNETQKLLAYPRVLAARLCRIPREISVFRNYPPAGKRDG